MRFLAESLARAVYFFVYHVCVVGVGILFPVRVSGATHVLRHGAVLVLSNHQSFLDPIVLGLVLGGKADYLTRASLLDFAPLAHFLRALGAIPLDQERPSTAGIRAALTCLEQECPLVLFPEGTRTFDGELAPLKPGALFLIRRAKVPVVVAGISGAFESWPRQRWLPWRHPVWVHFEPWEYPKDSARNAQRIDPLVSLSAAIEAAMQTAQSRRQRLQRRGAFAFGL